MKKTIVVVLVALLGLFVAACNQPGNTTIKDGPYVFNSNGSDGNSVETGVSFMFRAVNSYGKDGYLSITKADNGWLNQVDWEDIIITKEQLFRPLEPGEYYASLSSPQGDFNGYVHFFVEKGNVTGVYIDIQEDQHGSVHIVVLADISQGREGLLNIFKGTGPSDPMVVNLNITVQNGQQFGFDLEPGDYWMSITGSAFTSSAAFTVYEDQTAEVVIQMYEWPLITWYTSLSAFSPAGASAIGNGVEIMRFSIHHDQSEDIMLDHFTFELTNTGATYNACYLTYQDSTTGLFQNLGAAPVNNGEVAFSIDNGNLGDSTVPAYGQTTYKLACDIFAPVNTTLQASLVDFAGQPLTTAQQYWTLPLNGNLLRF